jgi:ATP-dependent DNA ligase
MRNGGGSGMSSQDPKPGTGNAKGLALRFPRLVRLREDKTIKEITTTEEVVKMFELQRGI